MGLFGRLLTTFLLDQRDLHVLGHGNRLVLLREGASQGHLVDRGLRLSYSLSEAMRGLTSNLVWKISLARRKHILKHLLLASPCSSHSLGKLAHHVHCMDVLVHERK